MRLGARHPARAVAAEVGIADVIAEAMPAEKVAVILRLSNPRAGSSRW